MRNTKNAQLTCFSCLLGLRFSFISPKCLKLEIYFEFFGSRAERRTSFMASASLNGQVRVTSSLRPDCAQWSCSWAHSETTIFLLLFTHSLSFVGNPSRFWSNWLFCNRNVVGQRWRIQTPRGPRLSSSCLNCWRLIMRKVAFCVAFEDMITHWEAYENGTH